jgi:hypothetical protein
MRSFIQNMYHQVKKEISNPSSINWCVLVMWSSVTSYPELTSENFEYNLTPHSVMSFSKNFCLMS